jgi:hypothetical protein
MSHLYQISLSCVIGHQSVTGDFLQLLCVTNMSKCHMMSQCVTYISFLSYVTYVTFVSNIIVMCHWSPNVSQETSYNWLSMMSGGRGGEGGEGGVKKCFLSLRQTALLSAEGKKLNLPSALYVRGWCCWVTNLFLAWLVTSDSLV